MAANTPCSDPGDLSNASVVAAAVLLMFEWAAARPVSPMRGRDDRNPPGLSLW
jgi:hypothetical protein